MNYPKRKPSVFSFLLTATVSFKALTELGQSVSVTSTDTRLVFAPYVWRKGNGFKETINAGAYLRFSFIGTGADLTLLEDSLSARRYALYFGDSIIEGLRVNGLDDNSSREGYQANFGLKENEQHCCPLKINRLY